MLIRSLSWQIDRFSNAQMAQESVLRTMTPGVFAPSNAFVLLQYSALKHLQYDSTRTLHGSILTSMCVCVYARVAYLPARMAYVMPGDKLLGIHFRQCHTYD